MKDLPILENKLTATPLEERNKMNILNKQEVKNYLLQRDPILMVDSILEISNNTSISEVTIPKNNMFVIENNIVSTYGVLEHVAQSFAVVNGYIHGVSIGFIGRIHKLKVTSLPKVAIAIKTYMEIIKEIENITLIKAEVKQENKTILSCNMYLSFNH